MILTPRQVEVRHWHIFCGLGGGARGFNLGSARVGNDHAAFRCLGGVDSDRAAIEDFGRLAGVRGTVLDLFSRELTRQSFNPELHFWLAQANYRLGNLREAGRHLELAQQNSTTPKDTALYAAKLGWLRAHGLQQ